MAGGREDGRMESTAAAAGENSEESNCLNGEAEPGGGDGRGKAAEESSTEEGTAAAAGLGELVAAGLGGLGAAAAAGRRDVAAAGLGGLAARLGELEAAAA